MVEAKRDDFEQGQTQCLAEMIACKWNNQKEGIKTDVFGIVSNGSLWQFYRMAQSGETLETAEYGISNLPPLLGVLDYVCAECSALIP